MEQTVEEEILPVLQISDPSSEGEVVLKRDLKHKPISSRSEPGSPCFNRSSSPTLSTGSESLSQAEAGTTVQRRSPPPCSLRERVSDVMLFEPKY